MEVRRIAALLRDHGRVLPPRQNEGRRGRPDPGGNDTVLGVDLRIENVAVISTGTFRSGAGMDHWFREYETRRASTRQRDMRHAHDAIQRVGEEEMGRFDQLLHRVANGIVREAVGGGRSHIAFEDAGRV